MSPENDELPRKERVVLISYIIERTVAMLTIRSAQQDVFRRNALRTFIEKLAAHLRQEHPEVSADLSDEELQSRIESGIEKAKTYGIEAEAAVAKYIVIMFEVGPGFDADVRVKQILLDPFHPPDARPDLLLRTLSEEDWDEIAATYPASW